MEWALKGLERHQPSVSEEGGPDVRIRRESEVIVVLFDSSLQQWWMMFSRSVPIGRGRMASPPVLIFHPPGSWQSGGTSRLNATTWYASGTVRERGHKTGVDSLSAPMH
jgi:hypothetical protein